MPRLVLTLEEDTLNERACWVFLPHEGFPKINLVYLVHMFLLEILFMLPLLKNIVKNALNIIKINMVSELRPVEDSFAQDVKP